MEAELSGVRYKSNNIMSNKMLTVTSRNHTV